MADSRLPASPPAAQPSRFTRVLYVVALALGLTSLGVRLVDGVRTGRVNWIEMAAPAGVLLALSGIMLGPRRPWLYYPLLVVSFALLVASYAVPRRRRPPAAPLRAPVSVGTAVPAAAVAR